MQPQNVRIHNKSHQMLCAMMVNQAKIFICIFSLHKARFDIFTTEKRIHCDLLRTPPQ